MNSIRACLIYSDLPLAAKSEVLAIPYLFSSTFFRSSILFKTIPTFGIQLLKNVRIYFNMTKENCKDYAVCALFSITHLEDHLFSFFFSDSNFAISAMISALQCVTALAREFDSSKEEKQRISLTGLIYFCQSFCIFLSYFIVFYGIISLNLSF